VRQSRSEDCVRIDRGPACPTSFRSTTSTKLTWTLFRSPTRQRTWCQNSNPYNEAASNALRLPAGYPVYGRASPFRRPLISDIWLSHLFEELGTRQSARSMRITTNRRSSHTDSIEVLRQKLPPIWAVTRNRAFFTRVESSAEAKALLAPPPQVANWRVPRQVLILPGFNDSPTCSPFGESPVPVFRPRAKNRSEPRMVPDPLAPDSTIGLPGSFGVRIETEKKARRFSVHREL
jgi:hypothetical protein